MCVAGKFYSFSWKNILFLVLICSYLNAQKVHVSDDFEDGDYEGWIIDKNSEWAVTRGIMQQRGPVPRYKLYSAHWEEGTIDGDFTLTLDLGFNLQAYPLATETQLDSSINKRSMGFGFSGPNGDIQAEFKHSWNGGDRSGLYISIRGGWYGSFPKSGYNTTVHDMRHMKMSLYQDTFTIWADGKIVLQTTYSGQPGDKSGNIFIFSFGPVGLSFDNVVLSSVSAPPTPGWMYGPVAGDTGLLSDFFFLLSEGESHLVYSTDGYAQATVEGGTTTPGSLFGWWVEEGVASGNKSWAVAAGQFTLQDFQMLPKATLEGWFKLFDPGDDRVVPVFHVKFNNEYVRRAPNEDWETEWMGLFFKRYTGEKGILYFNGIRRFSPDILCEVEFGRWTHLAWVRDSSYHSFYVDGRKVCGVSLRRYVLEPEGAQLQNVVEPPWGDLILEDIQLNVGGYGDYGRLLRIGEPYLYLDMLRATSSALAPEDFLGIISDRLYSPRPKPLDCDYNRNGRAEIGDVIALILAARDNPEDPVLDWDGSGGYSLNDAVSLAIDVMYGHCAQIGYPKASLSSLVEHARALTPDEIEHLEKTLRMMNLPQDIESLLESAIKAGNTSVKPPLLIEAFSLSQNVPNPFNPTTTISYSMPGEKSVHVTIKVYDLRGRLVRILVDGLREPGSHTVFWEGTDNTGRQVSSGVYMYRMQAGNFVQTRKMVLLK